MADDIVTRLRYSARMCNHGFPNGAGDSFPDPTYCGGCLRLSDAADEIERLRKDNELLSAVCHDLHHDATCNKSFCRLCGEGIKEWEEIRGNYNNYR